MTTLEVNENTVGARQFIEFVRTLPFVSILNESRPETVKTKTFKHSVAKSLLKPRAEKGLTTYESVDEMFSKFGI